MKKIYVIIGAAALCFSQLIAGNPRTNVEVEVQADDDYDDTVIWIGPGWYWGIWFDNEIEFNDYHHHHHGHHGHHHHGDHHGDHHGGDHHHGGGHGHHGGEHHHGGGHGHGGGGGHGHGGGHH